MVALGCPLCAGPHPATRVLRYDIADVALRFGIYATILLVVVTIASLGAAALGMLLFAALSAIAGFVALLVGGLALVRRRRERHAFYLVLADDRFVLGAGEHRRGVPWSEVTGVTHDDDNRSLIIERAGDAKALEIPIWLEGASTTELRDALHDAWTLAQKRADDARPADRADGDGNGPTGDAPAGAAAGSTSAPTS